MVTATNLYSFTNSENTATVPHNSETLTLSIFSKGKTVVVTDTKDPFVISLSKVRLIIACLTMWKSNTWHFCKLSYRLFHQEPEFHLPKFHHGHWRRSASSSSNSLGCSDRGTHLSAVDYAEFYRWTGGRQLSHGVWTTCARCWYRVSSVPCSWQVSTPFICIGK